MALQQIRLSQIKADLPGFIDFEQQLIHIFGDSYVKKYIATQGQTIFNLDKELDLLEKTLALLFNVFQENAFKKNQKGFFSHSAYEAILVGLAENINDYDTSNLKEKVNAIYKNKTFITASKHGRKALDRFQRLNDFSREYFINES